MTNPMKKILFFLISLLILATASCNKISDNPKEAAKQYMERMDKAAIDLDFDKGEQITTEFLNKFENDNKFFAALLLELQAENPKRVTNFIGYYKNKEQGPIRDMMIHVIAISQACEEVGVSLADFVN